MHLAKVQYDALGQSTVRCTWPRYNTLHLVKVQYDALGLESVVKGTRPPRSYRSAARRVIPWGSTCRFLTFTHIHSKSEMINEELICKAGMMRSSYIRGVKLGAWLVQTIVVTFAQEKSYVLD
ncbi:hypothetical protein AVEN_180142-1 [Araneus ventricosus]|uniref:Uncharacterized protein n=1 Tax=Araneus ventricosus TaxID=182803 RepID=A0A4Y2D498_ARAVE|nr:hypothetical protein AVEN_180142-1 [Araneus ventricosus]